MNSHVLAFDQGTTSSRAIVFGRDARPLTTAQQEFRQIFPQPGHVEHDPEDIWQSQLATARQALKESGVAPDNVAAIGITNQRETTIVWDRATGQPVANAIVWQCRRTAPMCEALRARGVEAVLREKTGLVLDAYFSATKIAWLLDNVPGVRARAERGELLFGTVDTFLIWRLTGGRTHVTDPGNASRTLLFNLHTMDWDDELLEIFGVPRAMLPDVVPSSGICGETDPGLFGRSIPVAGIAGDQQAATFGQGCFSPGDAKNTYGTGSFVLMNTGNRPVGSSHGLLTTIGWQIGDEVVYCLEGAIFVTGAAVQWLRDGLQMIGTAAEVESLAETVPDSDGVCFVPALTGLGAPHWDPAARGMLIGLTRGTSRGHIARATLEAIAFQTRDILEAMRQDAGIVPRELNVDGGGSANNLLMQLQADQVRVPVRRPVVQETTAMGAALLAGLATGVWDSLDDVTRCWQLDRQFDPRDNATETDRQWQQWQQAVSRCRGWATT